MKDNKSTPSASPSVAASRTTDAPNFELKALGDEAKNYDFTAARPPGLTTKYALVLLSAPTSYGLIESTANFIKSCLGGGIVAIHESYKACGLMTALILNLAIGFCTSYAMLLIVRSSQRMYGRVKVPRMSYPDLAEASLAIGTFPKLKRFSRCFRYLIDISIGFNLFGSCVVYQVVIAKTIKQLVENVYDDKGIRLYILYILLPCILLCMITSLKYLAPFSIVGNIMILTVVCATVYYGSKAATKSPLDVPNFKSVFGVFEFVGVCVFSMECVGAVLPIENNMTKPKKFGLVMFGGMIVVVSLVMMVGFFGYWGFGEESQSPVTLNFPNTVFPIILRVFMALMIYVTFGLNFYMPFSLVWFYLKRRHPPERYWLWERVYRAIVVTIINVIAIIFPNVANFIGLLGSIAVANLGFVYPAFIELTLDWVEPGLGFMKWRLIKSIATMAFGLMLCIVGTYINSKELISKTWGSQSKA